jgi:hypothetical protein
MERKTPRRSAFAARENTVISPFPHGNIAAMNKRLETLLDRIPTWPQEAQDWAVLALAEVEEKVRILQSLTPQERTKLAALRETINLTESEGRR